MQTSAATILGLNKSCMACRAKLARRTFAAAITPVMTLGSVTQITSVAVRHDHINQFFATLRLTAALPQVVGHLPSLRFVDPHQRRIDAQTLVHTERQRHLHGFHRVIAAIRVARKIGLTHACHDHVQSPAVSQGGRQRQEKQITPRHKGIGQAIALHGDGHIAGQSRVTDLPQDRASSKWSSPMRSAHIGNWVRKAASTFNLPPAPRGAADHNQKQPFLHGCNASEHRPNKWWSLDRRKTKQVLRCA